MRVLRELLCWFLGLVVVGYAVAAVNYVLACGVLEVGTLVSKWIH